MYIKSHNTVSARRRLGSQLTHLDVSPICEDLDSYRLHLSSVSDVVLAVATTGVREVEKVGDLILGRGGESECDALFRELADTLDMESFEVRLADLIAERLEVLPGWSDDIADRVREKLRVYGSAYAYAYEWFDTTLGEGAEAEVLHIAAAAWAGAILGVFVAADGVDQYRLYDLMEGWEVVCNDDVSDILFADMTRYA